MIERLCPDCNGTIPIESPWDCLTGQAGFVVCPGCDTVQMLLRRGGEFVMLAFENGKTNGSPYAEAS